MSKREDAITRAFEELEKDDHIEDLYIWETPAGSPRWTFHVNHSGRKRVGLTMTQAESYLLGWRDAYTSAP